MVPLPITSVISSPYYLPLVCLLRHTGLLALNHQIHSLLRNFIYSFCIFFLEWPFSNISIDTFLTPFRLLLKCLHYVIPSPWQLHLKFQLPPWYLSVPFFPLFSFLNYVTSYFVFHINSIYCLSLSLERILQEHRVLGGFRAGRLSIFLFTL